MPGKPLSRNKLVKIVFGFSREKIFLTELFLILPEAEKSLIIFKLFFYFKTASIRNFHVMLCH